MRMRFARVVAAWLAALTAFAGLTALGAPAAHADSVSEESQFLALTNQLRSSLGLQTLTPQAQLTSIARQWSGQMAAAGTISHNPNLVSQAPSNWTVLGENVGMGPAVAAIQTAFINSPEHYANLTKSAYNFVGVGVTDGANGTIFVTVDFMSAPGGGGAPPPVPVPVTAPHRVSPPRTAPAPQSVGSPATAPPAAPAPPTSAPPSTTPPAAQAEPTPTTAQGSHALDQVLAELRSVDATS